MMLNFVLLALFFTAELALAAPKIQNSDLATPAYLTGAGGTVAQLLNTSNMYDNVNAQVLNTTLASFVPNTRTISTTAPLTGGGNLSANRTIAIPASTNSVDGYLTAADHTTFSAAAAGGITSLTGDATASGPGAAALTLATVNGNVGSFTYGSFTVNAKGLITAAANGTAPVTAITVASANGLAGSSSGGATPALTLSTTLTSAVVKANGTALIAAVAGTDYQAPISTSSAVTNQFVTGFTAPNTFTRAQPAFTDISGTASPAQQALTCTAIASTVIDWSTSNCFTESNGATNRTFTFSNQTAGQTIVVRLTQTSGTVTWPTVRWAGGTAPTATASSNDVYTLFYDGTNTYGSFVLDMH